MKNIFTVFLIISFINNVSAQLPKDYSCNSHVKYSVDTINGLYKITYTFKDNKDILRTFKLDYDKSKILRNIARFGVPKSFYNNISGTQLIPKEKIKAIKKGFYKYYGNILKPDKSAIVSFYRPYCKAIAGGIIYSLMSEGCDNRINRIEMAMKFVQDIPYGIPEIKDSTWEIHGIYTPPELLIKGYGDCDSKAILFTCILSYLIDVKDILFLYQGRKHALIAIKGIPYPQQKYIEYEKSKYILADVTGPSSLAWGDDGNSFDNSIGYNIEKIKIKGYWFHNI